MIPVTKPFTPPIEKYVEKLQGIWRRNWLTNNGPLVNELELHLKDYLNVPHLLYVTNGTIALQLAIKALGISKKVITTPFSYVATTSSIVWENCIPVFADIDSRTFNIDPAKIEALIDEDTEAILATHCFGVPCDVEAIAMIAKQYGLAVIYDAAHCFGTRIGSDTVFNYGDISTCSFHATKIFHTIEGGAVITRNPAMLKTLSSMRNFGHAGPEAFDGVGVNGKNSEFHAAMGLINLEYIDELVAERKQQSKNYDDLLKGLHIQKQKISAHVTYNYAYYPIVFEDEAIALKMMQMLNIHEIFPRRYFYPSLNTLSYVQGEAPIASSIASRILCLPLYSGLSVEEQEMIARYLLRVQNA